MNIHEISRRSGVSLSRLRKLEKLGVLKVDKANEAAEQIRRALWRQSRLSVAHLLALLDDPSMIDDLGGVAVQDRAQSQIDALGDLSKFVPPSAVAAGIREAQRGLPVAIRALRRYVEAAVPPFGQSVEFHWLAVRILRATPPAMLEEVAASINIAFAKLRAVEDFKPWWTRDPDGKIRYHRPVNFDL